jgi:hypothetical protein
MTKPTTRSSTSGVSSPVDLAPPSLQDVLDAMQAMKSELLTVLDTKTSSTSTEFDSKLTIVSDDLSSKIMDLGHEITVLSTDIDTKVSAIRDQVGDFVDTAMNTARNEWIGDIQTRVSENDSKIDAKFRSVTTKLADLENLNLSDSKILDVLNDTTLDHVRSIILSPVIDEIIDRSVQSKFELLKTSPPVPFAFGPSGSFHSRVGFHQVESKDFNVSKFILNTDKIQLSGDRLVHLEHFWDSILRIFNTMCSQNQVYPCYRDLPHDFDFRAYLCDTPRLSSTEITQAKLNFRAFGNSLRLLLLDPSTITKDRSPKAYVKLLSLQSLQDGFRILRDLIFKLSPQLAGIFIDYSKSIAGLTIINGEDISEFYSRAQELAKEIEIANLPDGNSAALLHQFLFQLRRTADPTILGITSTYWIKITQFRRLPSHFTAVKLPWELHDLFSDLEASEISILSFPRTTYGTGESSNFAIEDYSNNNNIGSALPTPFAAYGGSHPRNSYNNNNSNAYRGSHNNNTYKPADSVTKDVSIHQTRDGRRYISDGSSKVACNLCFNKHPNPWHTADNCPFKHPTHIIEKTVRERVMQHNALHGAENKAYTKNQDSPSKPHAPPTSATANSAILCNIEPEIISPPASAISEQTMLTDTLLNDIQFASGDEIVHTETFQVPVLPTANMGKILNEDFSLDELIFDPDHYLSYSN